MEENRRSKSKYFQLLHQQRLQREREAEEVEAGFSAIHPGAPQIISLHHLSQLMAVDATFLASVVASPSVFYRSFNIPKKSGGHREILSPYPELQSAQRWILNNILAFPPTHGGATAYVKGKSIIDHCEPHCGDRDSLIMNRPGFRGGLVV